MVGQVAAVGFVLGFEEGHVSVRVDDAGCGAFEDGVFCLDVWLAGVGFQEGNEVGWDIDVLGMLVEID